MQGGYADDGFGGTCIRSWQTSSHLIQSVRIGLVLQSGRREWRPPPAQILVFLPDEVRVDVRTIKVFAERMRNESVQRASMVVIG